MSSKQINYANKNGITFIFKVYTIVLTMIIYKLNLTRTISSAKIENIFFIVGFTYLFDCLIFGYFSASSFIFLFYYQ